MKAPSLVDLPEVQFAVESSILDAWWSLVKAGAQRGRKIMDHQGREATQGQPGDVL
jgi:hypothetical protein